MSLFILVLVNGVPFSNLNNGASFFLGFNLNHVVKAFTGQIGPSFWNTSTTVGVAFFASFGHFRVICTVVEPLRSVLILMSFVRRVKSGSKVASCLESNSPSRKAPANASVATAHTSLLSLLLRCELTIVFLKTSMVLMVMGSLLWFLSLRFLIPSRFEIPLRMSFVRLLRKIGRSMLLTICNCLTPDRYVFTVAALTFLIRTNQSMKISVFFWSNGNVKSVLVSDWHLSTIAFAVLYALQVLFATPRLPNEARDCAVSAGRFNSDNNSAVQPTVLPYLTLPLTGVGQKVCRAPARYSYVSFLPESYT